MPVCEIDLRPGGTWRYVYRKPDGSEMTMQGSYREVVPPERLVSTESWGPEWPETVNTMDLDRGRGTDDDHDHDSLSVAKKRATPRSRRGMKEGMDQSFARLDDAAADAGRDGRGPAGRARRSPWLERHGSKRVREEMLTRYGITAPKAFGVPVGAIQQLARRLGQGP